MSLSHHKQQSSFATTFLQPTRMISISFCPRFFSLWIKRQISSFSCYIKNPVFSREDFSSYVKGTSMNFGLLFCLPLSHDDANGIILMQ